MGTWTYKATFSDDSKGIEGTFECIPSNLPGLLGKDESNPMWFGFKGGGHFMMRAFQVGDRYFAVNWDDPANPNDGEKRKIFLDLAQKYGYNLFSIGSHYLNRRIAGRGEGWQTPEIWDKAAGRPNAEEFRKMEVILDELRDRKIMVYPFAGFIGKVSHYPETEAEQERYVRYTMSRLSSYWNILYAPASPEPNVGEPDWLPVPVVERMGRLIQRYNVSGHLVSVHNATPDTLEGSTIFRDADWTDYVITQGPKTFDLAYLSRIHLRNHHPEKPLLAQETLWPGNGAHPSYDEVNIRKNAYVITMAAAAICFGDMNGNSTSGFSGSLDPKDRNRRWHDVIKQVWDFFETVPFYYMKPCQELLKGAEAYGLAQPGSRYLAYLPAGGTVNIEVVPRVYAVTWINAQNTSDRRPGELTKTGQKLTAPADGDDWLVYLQRFSAR